MIRNFITNIRGLAQSFCALCGGYCKACRHTVNGKLASCRNRAASFCAPLARCWKAFCHSMVGTLDKNCPECKNDCNFLTLDGNCQDCAWDKLALKKIKNPNSHN